MVFLKKLYRIHSNVKRVSINVYFKENAYKDNKIYSNAIFLVYITILLLHRMTYNL